MQAQSWKVGYQHMDRNRYCNRIPYDDNRVVLDLKAHFTSEEMAAQNFITDDQMEFYQYINASPMQNLQSSEQGAKSRTYIAAQGPLNLEGYASEDYVCTDTVVDFWSMIFEQKIAIMASITNHCAKYWPELGQKLDPKRLTRFGKVLFEVENVGELNFDQWKCRSLRLTHLPSGQYWDITQVHYLSWPDYGVPNDIGLVLRFLDFLDKRYTAQMAEIEIFNAKIDSEDEKLSSTFLIHCTAGIGRTGTIIALDTILGEIKQRGLDFEVDIFELVRNMRQQRMTMLEAYEQYEFCYLAVEAFVKSLT